MNNIISRLHNWGNGSPDVPERVLLYPTNRCNLKCLFCYQRLNPYDYSNYMPKEKWLELTKELCEMGVNTLQISGGGEAFLVPETVLEMMEIITDYKVNGRLVTNGTLLTTEIIKKIIDIGWNHIIFSVDGFNAKTHDYLRGVSGSFQKTIQAVRTFTELKEKYNKNKPLLEFSSVLCNVNYKGISELIKLAYSIGVKVITFEPVFVSNPFVHKLKLNESQREEFMSKIIPPALHIANSLGIITNLETLIDLKTVEKTGDLKEDILAKEKDHTSTNPFYDSPCFEPWIWPKIEATGEIGPCSTNLLKGETIKNKTFKQVWFGEKFNKFRERILRGDLPEGCENCVSTHVPFNRSIRKKLLKYDSRNR